MRTFVSEKGAVFPASLSDYKLVKAGQKDKAKWAEAKPGVPLRAPYSEIIQSWLRNGFVEVGAKDAEEVTDDGVPER